VFLSFRQPIKRDEARFKEFSWRSDSGSSLSLDLLTLHGAEFWFINVSPEVDYWFFSFCLIKLKAGKTGAEALKQKTSQKLPPADVCDAMKR